MGLQLISYTERTVYAKAQEVVKKNTELPYTSGLQLTENFIFCHMDFVPNF